MMVFAMIQIFTSKILKPWVIARNTHMAPLSTIWENKFDLCRSNERFKTLNKEMREVCGGKRKIKHGNLFLVSLLKVKIRVAKIILKIDSNK